MLQIVVDPMFPDVYCIVYSLIRDGNEIWFLHKSFLRSHLYISLRADDN